MSRRERLELVADVGDEEIEIAVVADDGGEGLPRHRLGRCEDHGLDPHHVFPPPQGSGKIGQLAIEAGFWFGAPCRYPLAPVLPSTRRVPYGSGPPALNKPDGDGSSGPAPEGGMRAIIDLDPFAAAPRAIAQRACGRNRKHRRLGQRRLPKLDSASADRRARDGTVAERCLFAKTQQRKALIPPEAHSSL